MYDLEFEPLHVSVTIATIKRFFHVYLFWSLKVILKECLLPMTSILMFKYFVKNQQFICSFIDCCQAKAGCHGDIMSFYSLSRMHYCLTQIVQYEFNQM